jgi:hypothetical protein
MKHACTGFLVYAVSTPPPAPLLEPSYKCRPLSSLFFENNRHQVRGDRNLDWLLPPGELRGAAALRDVSLNRKALEISEFSDRAGKFYRAVDRTRGARFQSSILPTRPF